MNTLRSLVTFFMVILSLGLCSCGEDFHYEPPTPSLDESDIMTPIDKLFSEYIGDYSNIKCRYATKGDSSVIFTGIKNKHLWFNEYDSSKRKLKISWEDIEETDTIQKVHTGYGEYKEVQIAQIHLHYYKKTKSGDIVTFKLNNYPQTIFTSNGKTKRTLLDSNNNSNTYDWYDESVLIGNCCYSYKGDSLFTIENIYYYSGGKVDPISYEEAIKFNYSSPSVTFERFNIKENESIWRSYLNIKLPSDSKINYTIIDKSTNIWKYKVEAVSYGGTKHNYSFAVNIENGEVKAAEEGVKVIGITLNKSQLTLDIGETYQLVDTINPNHAENQNVVWKSSNESVATVDHNGLVTAKSYGESAITATTEDGEFTATANVTVKAKGISDYITSKLNVAVINFGGYIQCTINCELVNDSKDDVELTAYTILDENEKVLLTKSYDHTVLGAKSSYTEGAYARGIFKELILRWTYIHNGKEYTYTTKYKVTSL